MKLEYLKAYKSLQNADQITGCKLPDLTVLTGLNGSGKSHFLEAIAEGHIRCDGIDLSSISLMSHTDLFKKQAKADDIKAACDEFLNGKASDGKQWKRKIRDIYFEHLGWSDASDHHLLVEKSDTTKPIWKITKGDVNPMLWEKVNAFKSDIGQNVFGNPEFQKFPFHDYIKQTYLSFGRVTQEQGFHYSQFIDIVGMQKLLELTQLFTAFQTKQEAYAHDQYMSNRSGKRTEYVAEFEDGNVKPWVPLNQALAELANATGDPDIFNFQITNPDDRDWQAEAQAKIVNKSTGGKIQFDDLSSGEKVIFSLVVMAAGDQATLIPPKLLLLDEIDATLHPSMIQMMMGIIQSVFLARGTKVILATHSPTTISLMDDAAVHLMKPGQATPKIEPTTRADALHVLTEGYATLQDLISFNEANTDYVVLSEGRNCQFLKKAQSYFDPEGRITILDIKDFGAEQLREIYKFLKTVNRTKQFVTVWDCDYRMKRDRDDAGNVRKDNNGETIYVPRNLAALEQDGDRYNRAYVFRKNEHSEYSRGIENLFNAANTEPLELGAHDGKTPTNKQAFERAVLNLDSEDVFANFRPLFEFILADGSQR